MDRKEMLVEIKRLRGLIKTAAHKAASQRALIDKLTAALIRVDHLMKKLTEPGHQVVKASGRRTSSRIAARGAGGHRASRGGS